ncbi:MAG: SGNH/GDSL hydrolase family protein [Candidatus Omnitrophica bacterium]|nr:SGNH/GDSL hydrolase family protein [Candidatus Omnitrophota bacterium]
MERSKESIKQWRLMALLVCSILFALMLGEIVIRSIGHSDEDGNFYVNTLKCYPYHLQAKIQRIESNKYFASKNPSKIYDRNLGWVPRPGSKSRDGLYFYNEDAIRTPSLDTITSKTPSLGVIRILIFGDSYTHGDGVPFLNTWGHYLENDLKEHNINAEVLNFGVGGYGMDQAFLRWKAEGRSYKPSIVIFGMQLENMNRNVNLIRRIYAPGSGIPFAKPRFILKNGNLSLINVPTPDSQEIVDIMNHFSSWNLAKYEDWYKPEEYQGNILLRSKLIAFVYSWFKDKNEGHRTYDKDFEKLSLKIITSFKEDVESAGVKFYVIYLPSKNVMNLIKTKKMIPYKSFFEKLEGTVPIIHPEAQFLKEAVDIEKFIPLHYSPQANKTVADVVADFILQRMAGTDRENK